MGKYASKVVEQARSWIGLKEADGSYKVILDTYNSQAKLPRGYRMTTADPWCATFVSAVALKLGYTDIIPPECSCTKMIELLKKLDSWEERDNVTPAPGWILFYDWQDTTGSAADNKGSVEHVGIVEKVEGNTIIVIEGNYSESVKRREVAVNGKLIRGYGVPKYDTETATVKPDYTMGMRYLKKGCKGEDVKALQILLIGRGYSCGDAGADGDFGSGTYNAVCKCQRENSLEVDGIVGMATMNILLGVQ